MLTVAWSCFLKHCLRHIIPILKKQPMSLLPSRSSSSPLPGLKQSLNLYPFVHKLQH